MTYWFITKGHEGWTCSPKILFCIYIDWCINPISKMCTMNIKLDICLCGMINWHAFQQKFCVSDVIKRITQFALVEKSFAMNVTRTMLIHLILNAPIENGVCVDLALLAAGPVNGEIWMVHN